MRRPTGWAAPLAALAAVIALAAPAAAQDSVFGIRGLGYWDRSGSARTAGMGGALAALDAESPVNPAAIGSWDATAGWAVGMASDRTFNPGTGSASLSSTRFPLLGVAGTVSRQLRVALTVSDYLDRNWSVSQPGVDTIAPGDTVVTSDQTESLGGVSDLGLAFAYRLTGVTVGLGLHALTGATRLSVTRQFPNDSSYHTFNQQGTTDFSGVGLSLGAIAGPLPNLLVGASLRVNGALKATTVDTVAHVRMPVELNFGAEYGLVPGVVVAASLGYATWSRASADLVAAGQQGARNVWSLGVGAEVAALHMGGQPLPLRLGYEWRQLPFPIGGGTLTESAFTGGLGLTGAGGRATVDAAVQVGRRGVSGLTEHYRALLLGVTIRP